MNHWTRTGPFRTSKFQSSTRSHVFFQKKSRARSDQKPSGSSTDCLYIASYRSRLTEAIRGHLRAKPLEDAEQLDRLVIHLDVVQTPQAGILLGHLLEHVAVAAAAGG